jgi:hypothetical protein
MVNVSVNFIGRRAAETGSNSSRPQYIKSSDLLPVGVLRNRSPKYSRAGDPPEALASVATANCWAGMVKLTPATLSCEHGLTVMSGTWDGGCRPSAQKLTSLLQLAGGAGDGPHPRHQNEPGGWYGGSQEIFEHGSDSLLLNGPRAPTSGMPPVPGKSGNTSEPLPGKNVPLVATGPLVRTTFVLVSWSRCTIGGPIGPPPSEPSQSPVRSQPAPPRAATMARAALSALGDCGAHGPSGVGATNTSASDPHWQKQQLVRKTGKKDRRERRKKKKKEK